MKTATTSPIGVLRCHGDHVSALCFLGDKTDEMERGQTAQEQFDLLTLRTKKFSGIKLASGNSSGRLSIWDVETKRCDFFVEQHSSGILEILELQGSSSPKLASQGRDGLINVYDQGSMTVDSNPEFSINSESKSFCRFSAHAEGNNYYFACSGFQEDDVYIWSTNTTQSGNNKPLKIIKGDDLLFQGVGRVGMCMGTTIYKSEENGRLLLTCLFESGVIATADVTEGKWINELTLNMFSGERIEGSVGICFDALNTPLGGLRGICGGSGNELAAINITESSSSIVKTLQLNSTASQGGKKGNGGCSSLKIRRDKKIFAVAGWDHNVHLFSWKKLTPLGILQHHSQSVQTLAFRGSLLASGGNDGHIALWDVY